MIKKDLNQIFADNLRLLLKDNHYTQKKFIEEFNEKYGTKFNQTAVSSWARGSKMPRPIVVEEIGNFFGYSAAYVLTDHEEDDDDEDLSTQEELRKIFAAHLKTLMFMNDLKQQDLIDLLERQYGIHVNQGTVSSWVTAKKLPRYETLERIGNLCGKDASYMLSKKEGILPDDFMKRVESADEAHREIIMKILRIDNERDMKLFMAYFDVVEKLDV